MVRPDPPGPARQSPGDRPHGSQHQRRRPHHRPLHPLLRRRPAQARPVRGLGRRLQHGHRRSGARRPVAAPRGRARGDHDQDARRELLQRRVPAGQVRGAATPAPVNSRTQLDCAKCHGPAAVAIENWISERLYYARCGAAIPASLGAARLRCCALRGCSRVAHRVDSGARGPRFPSRWRRDPAARAARASDRQRLVLLTAIRLRACRP